MRCDRLLADRAVPPGPLTLGLVLEPQQEAAQMRMVFAGLRFAPGLPPFVLPSRAGARRTLIKIFRFPFHAWAIGTRPDN